MLKRLNISNIVLIESSDIAFSSGLNVISGETGSGKSAIMNALSLIAGERADSSFVRHGADKGSVEVTFDIDSIPEVKQFLERSGIQHENGEELIIRREISASSKSRAFINNQQAQLNILRELGNLLLDIVGQHANQKLLSIEKHREILDLYGELIAASNAVSKGWLEEQNLHARVAQLIQNESQRLRDIEVCQMEIKELQEAQLKENEEESLFSEYTLLANAEEITEKISEIANTLTGDRTAVLHLLSRQKANFDYLAKIDPQYSEIAKNYENALIELQEIAHTISKYQSRIENNPLRLSEINDRLSMITRLKRKYGNSVAEVMSYQIEAEDRLRKLENADVEIEELQNKLKGLQEQNNSLCKKLTKMRNEAAQKLEKAVTNQLHDLNMPKAAFHCHISTQARNQHGDDKIEFFLSPNLGERQIPIKECASGGELSRVMLALQTILAGKEQTPTLIFDEIDANIGGETASVVGEQLRAIGKKHQVLCITHFPQVAKQANHHLQISKIEKNGRTITIVNTLDDKSRKKELSRMVGGG